MPILRLNATNAGVSLDGSPASAWASIRHAATHGTGPVIIMVHGFKYDPECASCSPHETIFGRASSHDSAHIAQWPRPLGFSTEQPDQGLGIAFGWRARGDLWSAQRSAHSAGRHLARVITHLHKVAPQRPIHAITHSMGSEVVFKALHHLHPGTLTRIIALSGASYTSRVCAAMQTPAGTTAELFNITSRENDLFDFVYERLMAPPTPQDRAMGTGVHAPNAVNIQLDCTRSLSVLTGFGAHIAPPNARVCHWSSYTRPGALQFYGHAMRRPQDVPLHALQQDLPSAPDRRWSRIFARAHLSLPLPLSQKTAS